MFCTARKLTLLALPVGLVAMCSCSHADRKVFAQTSATALTTAAAEERSPASVSVAASPATPTSEAPNATSPPSTTAQATTIAPIGTTPSNVVPAPWASVPIVAVGSRSGAATALLQQRLLDLGFWNQGPDGSYGFSTTQAVMAFQKYTGLPATGSVDPATASALTFATEKSHGESDTGTLVEVDKTKQLLFIVQNGQTIWTLNTSTGSGIAFTAPNKNDPTKIETGDAQTPDGLFKTNREHPDGWWDGDLGKIYRPKYFNGGIAIHGMTNVPNHPASHGCVRVSTMAMDFIWANDLVPLHTVVWVHG